MAFIGIEVGQGSESMVRAALCRLGFKTHGNERETATTVTIAVETEAQPREVRDALWDFPQLMNLSIKASLLEE